MVSINQRLDAETINLVAEEFGYKTDYVKPPTKMITCVFGEKKDNKVRQKATMAKMARGEMVRFLAENQIQDPEGVKSFDRLGFSYSEEDSDNETEIYTFIKKEG